MKIILATPIYPPDIGGPAQYVKNLAEGLNKKDFEIEILSYQKLKNIPQPFRFFIYLLRVFKKAKHCDIVYAFNLISCGLPSCLAAKILRKKFLLRLGGDFLWERAVEQGRTKKPLREYYQEARSLKEKFWIKLIKIVLNRADKIIFTGNFQKNIYQKQFGLKEEKIVIIPNPFPEIKTTDNRQPTTDDQLLYAGRLLKLKNLDSLIKAVADIEQETQGSKLSLKIIGEGPEEKNLRLQLANLKLQDKVIIEKPVSHRNLLNEIQKSYLCVLPSLTEISPNFALECLALRKPILLTKETGYYERFKENLIFLNPQNKKDMEEKILYLLDAENYQNYLGKIKKINITRDWRGVVAEHLAVFRNLCSIG